MNVDEGIRILFIEDNEDDFLLITRKLKQDNLKVLAQRVDSSEALHKALCAQHWDVVISDNNVPDKKISIANSLMATRKLNPNTPFIIVSGTIGEESAVNYMRLGANDYILKDNLGRLAPSIKREINESHLRLAKTASESRLKESESNFRHLAESITDMFFAIDKDYRCTYWNKAAEQLTRIPARQAVGAHIFELIPAKLDRLARRAFINSLLKKVPDHIEFDFKMGEQKRHFQTFVYPTADLFSVIIRDITEQKQTANKLNLANRELETFMYRVAHDIRGPVASLAGLIETVKHEPINAVAQEYFTKAHEMVSKLERSLRALQVVTGIKLEDLRSDSINLLGVLAQLQSKYQIEDEFVITLNVDTTEDIKSDSTYLQMAFEQLVQNAYMFRHPARKPELIITAMQSEKKITLTFADNGEGMAPEVLENAFSMFYRGSSKSTGEGLGLYLTRTIIEKLGGTIHAKSEVGKGTVFTVALPINA
ncbi:MAG: PAS domain S-box protein [Cytophagales bacterium]|nr:PAS domain S-box protein [Cytophagales bacterium]